MIQPNEMKMGLPMELSNGAVSDTTDVWDILVASRYGDLEKVKALAVACPELIYAQYNYAPPIHFAVREGHVQLVKYLLDNGAHDPEYKIYPFRDSLLTIAQDRGHLEIAELLEQYNNDPKRWKYKGENGAIRYGRAPLQEEFQKAVDDEDLDKTKKILTSRPEYIHDDTYFWGEGIMMMPAKDGNQKLLELLMSFGAKVPSVLKWAQNYYFKHYHIAAFLMEKGMNPNVVSWQEVRLLHDLAQKGDVLKAQLLANHGVEIDPIDDEYQSTPLGMAARWGHAGMVEFLLKKGADPNKSGASWSTPLVWAIKKGHGNVEYILRRAGAKV